MAKNLKRHEGKGCKNIQNNQIFFALTYGNVFALHFDWKWKKTSAPYFRSTKRFMSFPLK